VSAWRSQGSFNPERAARWADGWSRSLVLAGVEIWLATIWL